MLDEQKPPVGPQHSEGFSGGGAGIGDGADGVGGHDGVIAVVGQVERLDVTLADLDAPAEVSVGDAPGGDADRLG